MKIVVPVKRVIDYRTPIRLKADRSGVDDNVKMSINPFDEIALEEALRIKEKGLAQEVIVVSIGTDASQETLRSALAMGADRAVLIKTDALIEPLAIAHLLKQLVIEENPGMVILGKQAIDSDDNQVGQMLAGLLGWSQGTFASQLSFHDDKVSVIREIDGGLETLLLSLPCVITADLRLNEPRYISLPNIMKAKMKPLVVKEASAWPVSLAPRVTLLSVTLPEKKRAQIRVESAADLVNRLKNESRVLS